MKLAEIMLHGMSRGNAVMPWNSLETKETRCTRRNMTGQMPVPLTPCVA
jgi:hypothetical protein